MPGHNYAGHSYVGHDYMGHDYAGHALEQSRVRRQVELGVAVQKVEPEARRAAVVQQQQPVEREVEVRHLYSYGLYSHGLYSYGLYSYALYSYGLYSSPWNAKSKCDTCCSRRAHSIASRFHTRSSPSRARVASHFPSARNLADLFLATLRRMPTANAEGPCRSEGT